MCLSENMVTFQTLRKLRNLKADPAIIIEDYYVSQFTSQEIIMNLLKDLDSDNLIEDWISDAKNKGGFDFYKNIIVGINIL